ncbi:MAG: response regulator, partial [Candidatus Omnitrophica bacterium]|nr:response regulator [Candidatus Omnitrophota bacterium]
DGIETLRRLKTKNKELKVIMVTGKKPEDNDAFKASKALGALTYIHKPLELDELESVVLKELSLKAVKP